VQRGKAGEYKWCLIIIDVFQSWISCFIFSLGLQISTDTTPFGLLTFHSPFEITPILFMICFLFSPDPKKKFFGTVSVASLSSTSSCPGDTGAITHLWLTYGANVDKGVTVRNTFILLNLYVYSRFFHSINLNVPSFSGALLIVERPPLRSSSSPRWRAGLGFMMSRLLGVRGLEKEHTMAWPFFLPHQHHNIPCSSEVILQISSCSNTQGQSRNRRCHASTVMRLQWATHWFNGTQFI